MDIPEGVIHFLLAVAIPSVGTLFLFLLKRTFKDFETKLADLFTSMRDTLKQQQDHDTRIKLLDQRMEQLEDQLNGRKRRSRR